MDLFSAVHRASNLAQSDRPCQNLREFYLWLYFSYKKCLKFNNFHYYLIHQVNFTNFSPYEKILEASWFTCPVYNKGQHSQCRCFIKCNMIMSNSSLIDFLTWTLDILSDWNQTLNNHNLDQLQCDRNLYFNNVWFCIHANRHLYFVNQLWWSYKLRYCLGC